MTKARESNPICHTCSVEMDLCTQFQVEGTDTYRFACHKCGGVVNMQHCRKNGQDMVRQIALNGASDEYRPFDTHRLQQNSAKGYDRQFDLTGDINPAYSCGAGMRADHRAAFAQAAAAYNSFMAGNHSIPQGTPVSSAAYAAQAAQMRVAAMAQARFYQAQMSQQGYVPINQHLQPVGMTLGNHPQPVIPNPNALRRRMLGMPLGRRRSRR